MHTSAEAMSKRHNFQRNAHALKSNKHINRCRKKRKRNKSMLGYNGEKGRQIRMEIAKQKLKNRKKEG